MARYGGVEVGDMLQRLKPGELPDVGRLVGADKGFASQPGMDIASFNRRYGSVGGTGRQRVEKRAGGKGLPQFNLASQVTAQPQGSIPTQQATAGPLQGLLKAVQDRGQQQGREAAERPSPQQTPGQLGGPQVAPRPGGGSGGVIGDGGDGAPGGPMAPRRNRPVETLTKMVGGQY